MQLTVSRIRIALTATLASSVVLLPAGVPSHATTFSPSSADGRPAKADRASLDPIALVAETTSYTSSYQPMWGRGNCVRIDKGTWKRTSSYGSDFTQSGGVLIGDVIGMNLSVRNNYEYNAYIAYYAVNSTRKLCGSSAVPSRASLVRMAST